MLGHTSSLLGYPEAMKFLDGVYHDTLQSVARCGLCPTQLRAVPSKWNPPKTMPEEFFSDDIDLPSGDPVRVLTQELGGFLMEFMDRYGAFLAGGAIVSAYCGQPIHDFDIYFPSLAAYQAFKVHFFRAYASYYAHSCVEVSAFTSNALTVDIGGRTYQFIRRQFGTPEEVIATFDLNVCRSAFLPGSRTFVNGGSWYRELSDRVLRYCVSSTNDYDPIMTLYRIKKYMSRGFLLDRDSLPPLLLSIQRRSARENMDSLDEADAYRVVTMVDSSIDANSDSLMVTGDIDYRPYALRARSLSIPPILDRGSSFWRDAPVSYDSVFSESPLE